MATFIGSHDYGKFIIMGAPFGFGEPRYTTLEEARGGIADIRERMTISGNKAPDDLRIIDRATGSRTE